MDHGKTRLVKLLTGCNTDRLKAEQERHLTIELGFAPCFLGGNLCVGIVDVPGHEKFIKNMVAGVSGIDMAVLVVAADDGIMPQTIEHVQIMELLGVRHGIVALTKTDLVPRDRVQHIAEEIRPFLADTFMADAPVCPVSSESGEGFFEFYDRLVDEVKRLGKAPKRGVFRMPIERTFVMKGFGTVVTGIPIDGAIEVGAQVEVFPGGQRGRIRGIQRFLRDASEGKYGQCLALNIPEFNKKPPVRGQVVCLPGHLKPAHCLHIRLKTVAGLEAPLRNAEEVTFHTGTSEEPGKLYLLEHKTLGEGWTGLATVVVSRPVAAAAHDRFILRRPSPPSTVAGGEILAVAQEARRPRRKQTIEQLKTFLGVFEGLDPSTPEFMDKKVAYYLGTEQTVGASPLEISRGALLPVAEVKDSLARLVEREEVLALHGDCYIHRDGYAACLDNVEARIRRAKAERGALSLALSDLYKGLNWPPPLWRRIKEDLERNNLVKARGDRLLLSEALDSLDEAERSLMDEILTLYEDTGFHSPRPDELPRKLDADPARIERLLNYLCDEGSLVRLTKNVVLSYTCFKKAQDMVVDIIAHKGVLDSADFKGYLGSTRKYALAILDYLDSRKVTIRVENDRRLAPDYQKNLL